MGLRAVAVEISVVRMATKKKRRGRAQSDPETEKVIAEMVAALQREREKRIGPNSTFEQRRDADLGILQKVLWDAEEEDFEKSTTDAEEIEVGGKKFRRLSQASSATYFGRFGAHEVEEALYREVGVHNGPTIKPVELKVGIIEHMTPDMARVTGALNAELSSRALERVLRTVGHVPPSRAFLAERMTQMGTQIADAAAAFEEVARAVEPMPEGIASVSCGLDRMSVRMSEGVVGEAAPPATRTEPYERAVPPTKEHHYRKAWVGSTSVYDAKGTELATWRVAVEAEADPAKLAERVVADVARILKANPSAPVHCVQDAAPELRALPEAFARKLPVGGKPIVELVDFEHLMGYLDEVVDACEPAGDPYNMKSWYRSELLRDDGAIDRIFRNLREKAKKLDGHKADARNAVSAALRYIRKRKEKMRYAQFYKANLPIGSGATESTCWQMQQRVKKPAQSWEPEGLRGVLAMRGLCLSDRWDAAWQPFAAQHRAEITVLA